MTKPGSTKQPTAERFINAVNAHQQTEAMKAAVELEIFTAIAEGNRTAAMIAKRCQAVERGVRILCDFLTIQGFLTKDGPHYGLSQDSALFLNRHSPAYIGGAVEFLLTSRLREGHARLTEAVRQEAPPWMRRCWSPKIPIG
jgi:Dimerisation domain